MIIIVMLFSLITRGNFMQEQRPQITSPTRAERERQIEEAERERAVREAEYKQQLASVEIICRVETGERSTEPPPPPGARSSHSLSPAQEAKPLDIGGGIQLTPVIDEPQTVNYIEISFINHSTARVDMGFFDLRDILEVAVFDSTGKRLPDRPHHQRKFSSGYSRGIEPGETISTPLPLEGWVEIEKPGTYRLEISTKGDVHSLMKITGRTLSYTIEEGKDARK
jgi:hypothetical protein